MKKSLISWIDTFLIFFSRNSIPPTTTLENLNIKAKEAFGRVFVDVGFWGGVIPGNQVLGLRIKKELYLCEFY